MKNLFLIIGLLSMFLTSCEKDIVCPEVCDELHVIDTCSYQDLDAQMASFNLNMGMMHMTKETISPLVTDPTHCYFIDGSVRYLIDGSPVTQVNYEIGGGKAIRTDFMVYNSATPCESRTTSCIFIQPTCDTHINATE